MTRGIRCARDYHGKATHTSLGVSLMIEAGAKVAIGDVLAERGCETLHALEGTSGTALYPHLDVTREQHWNAMVAAVLGRFGTLNILINNAARDKDIAADAMRLWHGLNEAGRLNGRR
jgi:3(or 17)beta-hydroxysteroid dehydrogenase